MRILITLLSVLLIQLLPVTSLSGQIIESPTLVNNANYYRSNSGIQFQSSFGELSVETLSFDDIAISQGFVQSFIELVPVSGIPASDLKVTVGPVPCRNFLVIEQSGNEQLRVQLLDAGGRLLNAVMLSQSRFDMDMSNLPEGTYFLTINKGQQPFFKTIKIIKTR